MVLITYTLIKKRSEHNEGVLSTLREITLHQYNIEKISKILQNTCKRLEILYLQNNLIEKMENLHKLKCLKYLNLAINNIQMIEGVERCESLEKLDLTLNFVCLENLQTSIMNLKNNEFLTELNLIGNPCSDWKYCQSFIIYHLPNIKRLNSIEIKESDVMFAKQNYELVENDLRSEIEKEMQAKNIKLQKDGNTQSFAGYSIETRKQMYIEDEKMKEDQKIEDAENLKNNKFRKPEDMAKKYREKMCELQIETDSLPKQRNIGKYEFKFLDETFDVHSPVMRVLIESPLYLDTSSIMIDLHPLWFQLKIKKKLLLLHLPQEIIVSESRVRRVMSNGWIELILKKMKYKKRIKKSKVERVIESHESVDNDEEEDMGFDINDVPELE